MNQKPNHESSELSNKIGLGIAIGAGGGVALGLTLNNLALGIAIGVSLGVIVGAFLGRHDHQRTDLSPKTQRWLWILLIFGLLLNLITLSIWLTLKS